jgi:membrane protein insertase Oxa1/YidC/SpoIIIJ
MFDVVLSEIFYRPVLNALFGLYLLQPAAGFGLTLVLFTVALRALLTVATSSQTISDNQQEQLDAAVNRIEAQYADDPGKQKLLIGKLMRENSFSIVMSAAGILLQGIVVFSLFRLFTHDMRALDRLLYSFVSVLDVNYRFAGTDLSAPSQSLALITAVLMFLYLTFSTVSLLSFTSKSKAFQYLVPIVSYLLLTRLPGAVALFVMTSTVFSLAVYVTHNLLNRVRKFARQARLAEDDARQSAAESNSET